MKVMEPWMGFTRHPRLISEKNGSDLLKESDVCESRSTDLEVASATNYGVLVALDSSLGVFPLALYAAFLFTTAFSASGLIVTEVPDVLESSLQPASSR
jgi:hypothetical protein